MATNKELNPDSIYMQDFNDVRDLYRLIYLCGCFSGSDIDNAIGIYQLVLRDDGKSTIRKSEYSKRAKQLSYLLPDTYLQCTDGKIKKYSINNDIYNSTDDVLLKTFKMHNFTENQIMYYFVLLQAGILTSFSTPNTSKATPFTLNELAENISIWFENNQDILPDAFQKFLHSLNDKTGDSDSAALIFDKSSDFRKYFGDMVDAGYFIKMPAAYTEQKRKNAYGNNRGDYYTVAKDRLNEMTLSLGEGSIDSLYLLLNHLAKSNVFSAPYYLAREKLLLFSDIDANLDDSKNKFLFRHNPVYSILDNEIMYELLKAIKFKKTCSIEYKETNTDYSADDEYNMNTMILLPRYILSNEDDGRCFVIGLDYGKKEVVSLRLDYINRIKEKGTHTVSHDDLQLLKGIEDNIDKIWGTSAHRFQKEIIPLIVTFTFSDEDIYLKRQFLQEAKRFPYKKQDDHTYVVTFNVYDTNEMRAWLRKFGKHIEITENSIGAKTLKQNIQNDWKEMAKIYGII